MAIEIKVPVLPESIADATVSTWHKKPGEFVKRDENLVDLETDKVVLEVPSPADGVLREIKKPQGSVVLAEEVLGVVEAGKVEKTVSAAAPAQIHQAEASTSKQESVSLSPSVRRMAAEHEVNIQQLVGTGKGGRVMKEDILDLIKKEPVKATSAPEVSVPMGEREEKRVPMSRLRARIAERLVAAQHNAAMLTTFNEVNLQAVVDLRNRYREPFEKNHGVRLGFMSFFTRAVTESLKRFPEVNASIDGTDVVYHGYYDIGVAVSTDRGLVVPVLRDADKLSFAQIEKNIAEFSRKARDGQLTIEEMTGGTFTITNGGVFGSLLSMPIINPPQTAILGMNRIQERPVVENGQVVARPMMYLALSYDHRLIDGRDSVRFLVVVKELLEDPTRLLLDI